MITPLFQWLPFSGIFMKLPCCWSAWSWLCHCSSAYLHKNGRHPAGCLPVCNPQWR